jgi:mandelate racemase
VKGAQGEPALPATPGFGMSETLTIRSVEAVLVVVPMRRTLGTSAMGIADAPLVLIDLQTEQGVTGRAYLFCYLESAGHAAIALTRDVSAALADTVASPAAVRRALQSRFKLLGSRGLVAAVLAGVDVACWDALAIAAGLPLARMLGGTMRPTAAYNSNGLGLLEPQAAADEAQELVAEGFRAIKMRIGRPSGNDDLAAVRAVRAAIPPDVVLMSDYNQALSPNAARQRCRQLDDEGLYWIEEPVRHDDYATSADLSSLLRTPVQIGENFTSPRAMSLALQHHASDLVMPDLERIGGISGWLNAATLADAAETEMSSHLYPEVSAHLLAATPTAHWIEYVDWANPILQQPLPVADGYMMPPDRPGTGLAWNTDAVSHYRRG